MPHAPDTDDLQAHVLAWAKEHKISDGPLARMLTECAERLLTVNTHGAAPPKPTQGIVCRGHWWPYRPMMIRAMDLATHEVIFEDEEPHGSRNIAEYAAVAQAVEWAEEQPTKPVAIYTASYVAHKWITRKMFATSQRCPLWIENLARRMITTEFECRALVQYWDPEIWQGTPADYPGYDYLQVWNAR